MSRLLSLFHRRKAERELDEEFRFHLQHQVEEYIAQGATAEEARYKALKKMGGLEQRKEECRDAWGTRFVDSILQDVRYALRQLRKNSLFATAAVLTLALCIGGNAAIFSVVDAVIIRTLNYGDPGRLVAIHETTPQYGAMPVNAPHFLDWRKTATSFEQLGLIDAQTHNLTGAGNPKRVTVGRVSPVLFPMLGVGAKLGRTFLSEEDQAGRGRVAVIDDALWKGQFGGDTGILGRKLLLDGTPYDIVGVLPSDFYFPKISSLHANLVLNRLERPEVWVPFEFEPHELENPMGQFNYACIGRLKPTVTLSEARSELNTIQQRLVKESGQKVEMAAEILPLQDQIVSRSKRGLELTLAAAGIVLLIGCVNVANLLLGRMFSRTREMAVRGAIGASRSRLVQQTVIEGLVVSSLGALLALIFAYFTIPVISSLAPADLPRPHDIHLNVRVMMFAVGISLLTGLLTALLPAFRSADFADQLKVTTGSSPTFKRNTNHIRNLLLSSEIALSLMCLIASGLLVHSFVELLTTNPGFETQQILTVDVNLGTGDNSRYMADDKRIRFADEALSRLRRLPGVNSVALADFLPLTGETSNSLMYIDGPDVPLLEHPNAAVRTVNSDYFHVFGIPLEAGRLFEQTDRGNERVAVVSAAMAKRAWPGENPIGKRFRFRSSKYIEVIGVVSDVRGISLEQNPRTHVYLPYWQGSLWAPISFAVKTATDRLTVASAIRSSIREVDPELPLSEFRSMDETVAGSVAQRRFQWNLVTLFAMAALGLASLGIYGVMSYSVTQRTREIGIRMALGAQSSSVRRMVLADAFRVVAIGVMAGIPLAFAAAYSLRALLFRIGVLDLPAVAGACLVLTLSALIAAYLPAWRASRVEPMVALRHD